MFDSPHHTADSETATTSRCRSDDRLHRGHPISEVITTFHPGQQIYAEGDHTGPLYQVVYGMVRVYRILPDGRRQICAFQLPGEVFGLERDTERRFFADAVIKTGLLALRSQTDIEPQRELLDAAVSMLAQAQDHTLTLGCQSAVGRVAAFLLDMAERQHFSSDGIVDLPMTRSDIGDYLGLTIESISRALTKLRTADLVRMSGSRRLDIVHRASLEALCI